MTDQPNQSTLTDYPGEGMIIVGLVSIVLGLGIFLGSFLMQTTVEVLRDPDLDFTREVANIAMLELRNLVATGGALLAIIGALFYGFGGVIRQIAKT